MFKQSNINTIINLPYKIFRQIILTLTRINHILILITPLANKVNLFKVLLNLFIY
jgi:hypothetical protein